MKLSTLEVALLCAVFMTLCIGILRVVEMSLHPALTDGTLNQAFTSMATVTAGLLGAVLVTKGSPRR